MLMNKDYTENWIVQLKKCVLPLVLLELLSSHESYGYLLISKLKDVTGYNISEGTIYPILMRLYNEGIIEYKWVEQESGIPRKYYSLTPEGHIILDNIKQHWIGINNIIIQTK